MSDWQDADRLREMYVEKRMGAPEIASELGCTKPTIYRWMEIHGIETRSQSEAKVNSGLKSAPPISLNQGGYEYFREKHRGEQLQFLHHRLLAVAEYGFDAVADSIVHHKNRIKWDNRPENIEVVDSNTEHGCLHADDTAAWTRKLSWLDEIRVREMYRNGDCHQADVADHFGVCPATVDGVLKGRRCSLFSKVEGGEA